MRIRHDSVRHLQDTVVVTGRCVATGRPYSVSVPVREWTAWNTGMPIQVAMPSVSGEDRETLLSGLTPEGFRAWFGPFEPRDEGR